eukprot:6726983-Pyramimonas_sp.AAC.1
MCIRDSGWGDPPPLPPAATSSLLSAGPASGRWLPSCCLATSAAVLGASKGGVGAACLCELLHATARRRA